MNPLTYTERAQFLAAVNGLGEGSEIQDAALRLVAEVAAETPAPWAEPDPLAAERYLAARGATPTAAAQNAAEFEVNLRAIYAIATGKFAESFEDLARWIETHVDGAK
ncbi:hypothetical protein [Streptomyces sp. NPDC051310]|uniref:hypothetical protein n=1 Tax=Streptomyces sp. NPDC051310 TaxID=3365649 RepID=UPI00378F9899